VPDPCIYRLEKQISGRNQILAAFGLLSCLWVLPDNCASMEHDNLVTEFAGEKAAVDIDGCFISCNFVDLFINPGFGRRVEGRGKFLWANPNTFLWLCF